MSPLSIIATDYSGFWMMLQFPFSALFALIGCILFFSSRRHPALCCIPCAVAIFITGAALLFEPPDALLQRKGWEFMLTVCAPAFVSGVFLFLALFRRRPPPLDQ